MNELENLIAKRIASEGTVTFAAFMEMALYSPGLGYYTSSSTEIGRAGDFYTSPHLSPVFGAVLARQAIEMWEHLGRPEGFTIVEPGGGRGYLALDMLWYLKNTELFDHLRYIIVELNPSMKTRQEELLAEYREKLSWCGSPEDLEPFTGVVMANEVLDALPVHLVEMTEEGLKEIYVALDGDAFVEHPGPPSTPQLEEYLKHFSITLPAGYRTEVNLAARDWLAAYERKLQQGFMVIIDYGHPAWDYYGEDRNRGTLLCYREHQMNEEPLEHVGEQDITAHVNFTDVRDHAEALGMKPLGYVRQGPFLVALGLDEVVMEFMEIPPPGGFDPLNVKGLIMPGTMGESHKVMVLYKGKAPLTLRGFSMKNELEKLD